MPDTTHDEARMTGLMKLTRGPGSTSATPAMILSRLSSGDSDGVMPKRAARIRPKTP